MAGFEGLVYGSSFRVRGSYWWGLIVWFSVLALGIGLGIELDGVELHSCQILEFGYYRDFFGSDFVFEE